MIVFQNGRQREVVNQHDMLTVVRMIPMHIPVTTKPVEIKQADNAQQITGAETSGSQHVRTSITIRTLGITTTDVHKPQRPRMVMNGNNENNKRTRPIVGAPSVESTAIIADNAEDIIDVLWREMSVT